MRKAITNIRYVPVVLPSGEKLIERTFYSKSLDFTGKIDQAIVTSNEVVILEIKYRKPFIGKTLLTQIGLQAILCEENLGKPCNTAVLEFVQGGRQNIQIAITQAIKDQAIQELTETKKDIVCGEMPYSKYDHRCDDCAYRRVCPVGLLKRSQ